MREAHALYHIVVAMLLYLEPHPPAWTEVVILLASEASVVNKSLLTASL